MELITEPDVYTPSLDEIGNYIDNIPSFIKIKHGLRCPCGSRKDKTYSSYGVFVSHIKTKTHQKWLENINLNKSNIYVENINLRDTVQNQKMIIAKMEKQLQNKSMTIDYLTKQLCSYNQTNNVYVNNLLEFDE